MARARDIANVFSSSTALATDAEVDGLVAPMGLVHINTQTFSAVSAVSLPNDTFTSTYVNYKIIMNISNASSVINYLRLRASGTDASGADYDVQFNELANGNKTTSLNATAVPLSFYANTLNMVVLDVLKPKDTSPTQFQGNTYFENSYGVFGAQHDESTAYDSLTVYPASSTFSGTLWIYGYKV